MTTKLKYIADAFTPPPSSALQGFPGWAGMTWDGVNRRLDRHDGREVFFVSRTGALRMQGDQGPGDHPVVLEGEFFALRHGTACVGVALTAERIVTRDGPRTLAQLVHEHGGTLPTDEELEAAGAAAVAWFESTTNESET